MQTLRSAIPFEVGVSCSFKLFVQIGGEAMTDARDWAKAYREKQEAKRNAETDRHQRVAMQRDIVAERMPVLWEDLITEYRNYVTAFNEETQPDRVLAIHRSSKHSFMVRPDARPEIITGKFDPTTYKIEILAGSRSFPYVPDVVLEGTGSVQLKSAYAPQKIVTCAEVVKQTLQAGLE
jgi:hypothetical protein